MDVVCYDRLRYLKANNSYTFYAQSAADIIKQICEDLQVDVGTLADTGYKLPSLVMQDKKLHRHHQYCHPEDLAEYRHGLCFLRFWRWCCSALCS